ncbi:hypothetical protein ADUPG1_010129, partial [Aduncisulcus paluster]
MGHTLPIPENQTLLPHKSQAIVQPKATRIPLCRLLCYMQVPIGFLPATPPMRHHMSYSTKLQIHNDRNPAKRKEYRLSRSSKARYPDKIPVLGASAPTPTPILTESYRRRLRESVDHLCEKQLERASLGLHSLGSSQESPVKPQSIIRIVPNTSSSSLFSKTNHISKKGQRKKLHKKYLPSISPKKSPPPQKCKGFSMNVSDHKRSGEFLNGFNAKCLDLFGNAPSERWHKMRDCCCC